VRFEEIKAPGDVLRRNQLVTINALSQAGFEVKVQSTKWHIDPNQPYVVVDLETTGGKAQNDRITEIAIVTVIRGEIADSWSSLVNPERHIPRFITGLTGISNDMVKNAPTFEQLADVVADKLAQGIFVAHNVNFDYGFLKQSFMRMDRSLQRPKLCTVQLGRKYLPGHESYSLGKICAQLGIELHNHHRALSDATATAHLLNLINEARTKAHE
jgi:DNA polymerase-3 subunit epsilon